MEKEILIPEKPYAFKSGKHQGEFVESFIFKNSNYLFRVRNRDHRLGDVLDRHLDFIFEAGSRLQTRNICSFCKERNVKFFLFSVNLLLPGLTCCENSDCQQKLKILHPGIDLISFRISSLGIFKKITARRKAEIFFKKIYGLPRIITANIVFSIFREAMGVKDLPPAPQPPRSRYKVKPNSIQLDLF